MNTAFRQKQMIRCHLEVTTPTLKQPIKRSYPSALTAGLSFKASKIPDAGRLRLVCIVCMTIPTIMVNADVRLYPFQTVPQEKSLVLQLFRGDGCSMVEGAKSNNLAAKSMGRNHLVPTHEGAAPKHPQYARAVMTCKPTLAGLRRSSACGLGWSRVARRNKFCVNDTGNI